MQRGDRTRALLVQTWRLLAPQPHQAPLTIKRLCERAGVNRGTFYLHFESLDEIRLLEEERIVGTLLSYTEHLDRAAISEEDPITDLVAVFSPVLSYVVANREDIPLVLMLLEGRRFRERLQSGIRTTLERWFGHRLDDDPDSPYVAQYLGSAIFGVVAHWLRTGAERPPSEIVSIIVRLNWEGPLHWDRR